jgi:hypothetical protein
MLFILYDAKYPHILFRIKKSFRISLPGICPDLNIMARCNKKLSPRAILLIEFRDMRKAILFKLGTWGYLA